MAGGQATLAVADHPGTAVLARVLVGAGDAMTFIAVLRLIPAWFLPGRVPLLTQLTGQVGQLGQVASTIPLAAALAGPGWTPAYLGAAALGVLTAVVVLAALRDRPPGTPEPVPSGWHQAVADLHSSFTHPGTRLGLWSHFSTQFSGLVFALLWGYPFLTVGLGYSPALAGGLLTMMVLAAAAIGPVLGQLTAHYPMRRSNLIIGVLIATVLSWTVVLAWPGRVPLPVRGSAAARPGRLRAGVGGWLRLRPLLQPRAAAGGCVRDRQHGRLRRVADHHLRHRGDPGPPGSGRELQPRRLQGRLLLPVPAVGGRLAVAVESPSADPCRTAG